MPARFKRLSRQDFANLLIEAPDTPMHMAVLMVLDGGPLLGPEGELALDRVRGELRPRLAALPELREVVRPGGPFGRPVWVDDARFRISSHVRAKRIEAPGGEPQLLAEAARLLEQPLDRSRPLWQLWLLTGLPGARLGALLMVHHAVTDGLGMLRIAEQLLDSVPGAPVERPDRWVAAPAPGMLALAAGSAVEAGSLAWAGLGWAVHPVRLARSSVEAAMTVVAAATAGAGRRASAINRPIGRRRRLAVVRLRLAEVRAVAHRHSATVNDVVLTLAASGVGAALRARGRPTERAVANALLAANPVRPDDPGRRRNQAGSRIVSLPLDQIPAAARLAQIAPATAREKGRQRSNVVEALLVYSVLAGAGRVLSRHQQTAQLAVSNLVGPAFPLYLAGCRLLEAIPVTPISGNVTIDFCALSYDGAFEVGILADAEAWPDLPVVVKGMRAAWVELLGQAAVAA